MNKINQIISEEIQHLFEENDLNEVREKFKTLYHGTDAESAESIKNHGIDMSKGQGGYFGWGFYTTPDYNLAKSNYSDFSGEDGGVVMEFELTDNANILDLRDAEDFELWKKYADRIYQKDLYKLLTKVGIDGLWDDSFDGVVIYNPNVLRLKNINDTLNEQQDENNLNDNFWKWFGNSKVKNNDGTPKIVYRTQKKEHPHGTYNKGKYVFGIYFSEDKNSTKIYGEVTESYFLKLKNPKILRGIEHNEMWIYSIITKDKYQNLIDQGHDGAIWLKNGQMYEIVVFDVAQIKSTDNDGTWDDDNDIYS